MANIVTIQDLSGVGRCSLTAALPVLAVMGHHCCPLPTAVLSKQTGFGGYSYLDFTPHMQEYLHGWRELQLEPDMIFSGFLSGAEQTMLIEQYVADHAGATLLIDPVMGDGGVLYDCYDDTYICSMRHLIASAHYLTPNLTEFLLLTNGDQSSPPDNAAAYLTLLNRLEAPRLRQAVVTGVRYDGNICNVVIDPAHAAVSFLPTPHTGISYSGTGDLFSSVLCGCIANGWSIEASVEHAARFIYAAVQSTPVDADPRCGIHFEKQLSMLIPIE